MFDSRTFYLRLCLDHYLKAHAPGPILESKGMHEIFQKMGQKMLIKDKK